MKKLPGNYGLEFLDISKIITVSELDGVHINVDEQFKLGNIILKKLKKSWNKKKSIL